MLDRLSLPLLQPQSRHLPSLEQKWNWCRLAAGETSGEGALSGGVGSGVVGVVVGGLGGGEGSSGAALRPGHPLRRGHPGLLAPRPLLLQLALAASGPGSRAGNPGGGHESARAMRRHRQPPLQRSRHLPSLQGNHQHGWRREKARECESERSATERSRQGGSPSLGREWKESERLIAEGRWSFERHAMVPSSMSEEGKRELGKAFLVKAVRLVALLDAAKSARLLTHNPLLFRRQAEIKSSAELLRLLLSTTATGTGMDPRRLLGKTLTLAVSQTPAEEFNFLVSDLTTDIRDGIRLLRASELLLGRNDLVSQAIWHSCGHNNQASNLFCSTGNRCSKEVIAPLSKSSFLWSFFELRLSGYLCQVRTSEGCSR